VRPVCVKCHREMVPVKNEVLVRDEQKGDFPSTYRYGDLYECPGCKGQIITGFGKALDQPPKNLADAIVFRR